MLDRVIVGLSLQLLGNLIVPDQVGGVPMHVHSLNPGKLVSSFLEIFQYHLEEHGNSSFAKGG